MEWTCEAPALSPMFLSKSFQPHRTRRYSKEDWAAHKPFITDMYPLKGMTLAKIEQMLHEKKLFVNQRQLKRKIGDWELDKKVKPGEIKIIARKRQLRRAQGKSTSFRVRGYPVDDRKVDRWIKRTGTSNILASIPTDIDSPSTASAISYNTISRGATLSPCLKSDLRTMEGNSVHPITKEQQVAANPKLLESLHRADNHSQRNPSSSCHGTIHESIGIWDNELGRRSPASFTAPPSPESFPCHIPRREGEPPQDFRLCNNSRRPPELPPIPPSNPSFTPQKKRYLEIEENETRKKLDTILRWFGPDHKAFLDNTQLLVELLLEQGRHCSAERSCKNLIEQRTRLLGENHPRTLDNLRLFASILRAQGKYKESLVMCRRIYRRAAVNLLPSNRILLDIKEELATVLRRLAQYSEARQLLRETVEMRRTRRVTYREPDLNTTGNLALVLEDLGKYDESENMFRELLRKRELGLGHDDPLTLLDTQNLGRVLIKQNRYLEAEEKLREVCNGQGKVLGSDHPDTLDSRRFLAHCLFKQAKYEESEMIIRDTIQKLHRISGTEHPSTVKASLDLVEILSCRGRYVEAQALGMEVLSLCMEVFGADDIHTLESHRTLGIVHLGHGHSDEAVPLLEKAVKDATECLGAGHPITRRYHDEHILALEKKEKAAANAMVINW